MLGQTPEGGNQNFWQPKQCMEGRVAAHKNCAHCSFLLNMMVLSYRFSFLYLFVFVKIEL